MPSEASEKLHEYRMLQVELWRFWLYLDLSLQRLDDLQKSHNF